MNITYSMKQTKAIKTLLYNQDLDNESIQLVKHSLRKTDISDMTLVEAHRIIDKMSQTKKEAMNEILLGKVRPLPRYKFEDANKVAEQMMKEFLFLFLFFIIIGAVIGGHTYIGAAIFLCWLVYLVRYTDYIIPKWIKVQILHIIRKKDYKALIKEK